MSKHLIIFNWGRPFKTRPNTQKPQEKIDEFVNIHVKHPHGKKYVIKKDKCQIGKNICNAYDYQRVTGLTKNFAQINRKKQDSLV